MSKKVLFMKKLTSICIVLSLVLSVFAIGVTADAAKAKKKKAYVKSISVKAKKATLTKKAKSKKIAVTVKVANKASKKFTVKSSSTKIAKAKVSGSKVVITAAKFYEKNKKATITVTTKAKNAKGKKLSAKIAVVVKGYPKATEPTTPTTPTEPTTPGTSEAATSEAATSEQAPTDPSVKLEKITATASANVITVGSTAKITVESATTGATIDKVEFTSDNEYTATVNADGVVTGMHANAQPVTITVRAYDKAGNVATETVSITVNDVVEATLTGIDSTATLFKGQTKKLNPIASVADPVYKYTSSDEKVATVSADGTITAVAAGTANIIVTIEGTNASATCALTVKDKAIGIDKFYASHAAVLTIKFTAPVSEAEQKDLTITIKKGEAEQTLKATWAEDGTSVDFTNDANLEATSYTATLTAKDVSLDPEKATATCTLEERNIKSVKIKSVRIPKCDGAKIYYEALDQYGDNIKSITGDKFNWIFRFSDAAVDASLLYVDQYHEGYIVLDNLKSDFDNLVVDKTTLTVKAEWAAAPTEINTTADVDIKSLTVEHIELEGLVENEVYQSVTDKTYKLKYVATDNYGDPIDWSIYGYAGAYNNKFDAKSSDDTVVSAPTIYDDELIVYVWAGQKGSSTITIAGYDLKTSSLKIDVLEAPKPEKLKFEKSEYTVIAGDPSVLIPVTIVNQYGKDMTVGSVNYTQFHDAFKNISTPLTGLNADYVTNSEGDFIEVDASALTEKATTTVYFNAYDSAGKPVVSELNVRVNEPRKAGSISFKGDLPDEMVKGEIVDVDFEILDNHGALWTADDVDLVIAPDYAGYIHISYTLSGGKGVLSIEAWETSYKKGDIAIQFEMRDSYTSELISTSKAHPVIIYDNFKNVKLTFADSDLNYKSGQKIKLKLTAYDNDDNVLTTYNKSYKKVKFTQCDEYFGYYNFQYADVTFVNGVANVEVEAEKAFKTYYLAEFYADGFIAVGEYTPNMATITNSEIAKFGIAHSGGYVTITALDKNDNTVLDYAATDVYIAMDKVKANEVLDDVASNGLIGINFTNGVLDLYELGSVPSGTKITVTAGSITGEYTEP